MELWLRRRVAEGSQIDWDERLNIGSLNQWRQAIHDPQLISSVLWPTGALFSINGPHYVSRRHHHEIDYQNDPARNRSYRDACERLAIRLDALIGGASTLVYAPMRGAFPIWQVTQQFLKRLKPHTYYPVTSSFVKYPEAFNILSAKGKPASGRHTNVLELQRLRPFLGSFEVLLYIDEIISGGMMWGHTKELMRLAIDRQLKVVVCGLADRFGARSSSNRQRLYEQASGGRLFAFLWEGCEESITEDQKFLLGAHYVDYRLGPHIVPMLTPQLEFFEERKQFLQEVLK